MSQRNCCEMYLTVFTVIFKYINIPYIHQQENINIYNIIISKKKDL